MCIPLTPWQAGVSGIAREGAKSKPDSDSNHSSTEPRTNWHTHKQARKEYFYLNELWLVLQDKPPQQVNYCIYKNHVKSKLADGKNVEVIN